MYFTAILLIFDMLLMWAIVKKNPRLKDLILYDAKAIDMTPWKNGKIWATVTLLVMVAEYVIFSPMGFVKSETSTFERYQANHASTSVTETVQE